MSKKTLGRMQKRNPKENIYNIKREEFRKLITDINKIHKFMEGFADAITDIEKDFQQLKLAIGLHNKVLDILRRKGTVTDEEIKAELQSNNNEKSETIINEFGRIGIFDEHRESGIHQDESIRGNESVSSGINGPETDQNNQDTDSLSNEERESPDIENRSIKFPEQSNL